MNDLASSDAAISGTRAAESQSCIQGRIQRPGGFARASRQARSASILANTIALDVLPRLLLAHRLPPRPAECDRAEAASEVAEITALILAHDIGGARLYAEAILARGAGLEALSLDLLAPAARLMGTMWEDDTADFTSVSLGVWQLHQMMHDFTPEFSHRPTDLSPDRRVLLTPMPGEQHSFGVAMLAQFFRGAGWDVISGPLETQQDLTRIVRRRWFAVIGISLSWVSRLEALATVIRAVRRASRNPGLGVMVGGSLFNEHPELVRLVGADATAMDARSAPVQAAGLVSLMAGSD